MKPINFVSTTIQLLKTAALFTCLTISQFALAEHQYSGINNISFTNETYNKPFAGNGFLINFNKKLYAVTVKHALLEAKTPEMQFVDIKDHVNNWLIHPNKSPKQYIRLGKLLNTNPKEAINMKILSKDWLVFDVLENNSNLKVLTLRDTPIKKGEKLTAFGCSYANQTSCEQDNYVGFYLKDEPDNLRISMPELELAKLRGLSGSPVLDKNEQVVGIVSNILKSSSGEGFDFAPANLKYLREVLNKLDS